MFLSRKILRCVYQWLLSLVPESNLFQHVNITYQVGAGGKKSEGASTSVHDELTSKMASTGLSSSKKSGGVEDAKKS